MKVEKNEPFSYEGCDIDEIDKILLDENLIIDNFNSVKQKLEVFLKDGKEKIQIIADFDHTITALGDESNKTPTSYQTMIESPFLPTIVREQVFRLVFYYRMRN